MGQSGEMASCSPPMFLGGAVMSKVTALSLHGKSLAEMSVLAGINALCAQYFMSCRKRREVLHVSWSHTDGGSVTSTGLGIS